MFIQRVAVAAATLALAAGGATVCAQTCQPEWDRTIGTPGVEGSGYILPMMAWNDGTGEKLYVGGSFTNLNGQSYVAAYDLSAQTWGGLGGGITEGGSFLTSFEKFNPGTGEKLIVGGANFSQIAGVPGTRGIAMWDGQNWLPTGANFDSFLQAVWSLHVWDDGSGPKLYIGGSFETIGGVLANRIARWDGTTFEPLAGGVMTAGSTVFAITNYDDGSGDALYISGNFSNVDGQTIQRLARWNGTAWSQVGFGIQMLSAAQGINEMRVLDLGSGPALYISGTQFSAGGNAFANAARWDGVDWAPIGQAMPGSVRQMVVLDEGNGPTLYAGSQGATGGGTLGYYLKLDEAANWWETTGDYFNDTIFGVYKHGNRVYLGGSFTTIDDGAPTGPHSVGRIIARTVCEDGPCYANCDGSTTAPVLNVDDFTCFINEFAAAQALSHEQQIAHYANCDSSTTAPVLNVDDFTCFINAYAAGCP